MVADLGEEEARRLLESSSDPGDRLVLQSLNSMGGGEQGGASRALRFLGQGVTQAFVAGNRYNPVKLLPNDPYERIEQRHEQMKREPEGALENVSYYSGRLAPELGASYGAGALTKAMGFGRLAQSAISNIPSALTFGSSKEDALVQSDNPAVRIGAEYAANLAGEGVFSLAGRALRRLRPPSETISKSVDDLTEGLRGALPDDLSLDEIEGLAEMMPKEQAEWLARRARPNPDEELFARIPARLMYDGTQEEVERWMAAQRILNARPPSEGIGKSLSDLTEGLRGRPASGAREILEEEVERQTRSLDAAKMAEVNPDDYVNFSTMGLSPEAEDGLRAQVRETVVEHGLSPKEVISNKQTIADSFGVEERDLIRGTTKELPRVQMLAMKNYLKTNTEQVARLSQMLAGDIPVARREEIVSEIAHLEGLNDELLTRFTLMRSEAGRQLQSLKIMAQFTNDPFSWYLRAAKVMDGRPVTEDVRHAIDGFLRADDMKGLTEYVSGLRKVTVGDRLAKAWKAGLLTIPVTHIANFTGNTTMFALESASDVTAYGLDSIAAAFTGRRQRANPFPGIGRGIMAGARALVSRDEALTRDILAALPISKKGLRMPTLAGLRREAAGQYDELSQVAPLDPKGAMGKFDIHKRVRFNNAFLDAWFNLPFRLLGEADAVFSQANAVRSLENSIRVAARNGEGVGATAAERLAWLRQNPGDERVLQAIADAEFATFRDKTLLGTRAGKIKRAIGVAGEPIIPFTQTPASIATKVTVDYTPAGVVKALGYWGGKIGGELSADAKQKAVVDALARAGTGSAVIALGWVAMSSGIVTGDLPENESDRRQFYLEGKIPYAVKIGGKWRSLERISPFGNLFHLGAAMHKYMTEKDLTLSERLAGVGGSTLRQITQQPFIAGTRQALDVLTDRSLRGFGDYAGGLAGSVVPGIVRATAQGVDPTIREARGITGRAQANIPFLSRGLPARIDEFGQEVRRPGGMDARLFDIFRSSPDKLDDDQLLRSLHDAGIQIGGRDKMKGESPEEYEQRMRDEGQQIRLWLEAYMDAGALTPEMADDMEDKIRAIRAGMTKDAKLRQAMRALGVTP